MDPNTGELIRQAELERLQKGDPEAAARFSVSLQGTEDEIRAISDAVVKVSMRRTIAEAVTDVVGAEDIRKASSPSTKMALALAATGKKVYEGTVPRTVVQRRRTKNKAARRARRVNR